MVYWFPKASILVQLDRLITSILAGFLFVSIRLNARLTTKMYDCKLNVTNGDEQRSSSVFDCRRVGVLTAENLKKRFQLELKSD